MTNTGCINLYWLAELTNDILPWSSFCSRIPLLCHCAKEPNWIGLKPEGLGAEEAATMSPSRGKGERNIAGALHTSKQGSSCNRGARLTSQHHLCLPSPWHCCLKWSLWNGRLWQREIPAKRRKFFIFVLDPASQPSLHLQSYCL